MSETHTIEEPQRVLNRGDMQRSGALERFREGGQLVGAESVMVSQSRGGMRFENMMQMMEFARLMAVSDIGVPAHCRGNPGLCLRITIQADAWGFDPFSVADKSYKVGDRLSYESQLVHAVIERRAPLEGRLRMDYSGEGPTRRCKVIGRLIGEKDPFIWEGPEFQQILVKNSPEWKANPDKQLWYHASRDWARIYCPDVLLGVYTRDELDGTNLGPDRARQVDDMRDRLPSNPEGGFSAEGIAKTLGEARGEAPAKSAVQEPGGETVTSEPANASGGPGAAEAQADIQSAVERENMDPETGVEYTQHAESWIARATDKRIAEQLWDSERELRAKCKVSVKERKRLEKMLQDKFGE